MNKPVNPNIVLVCIAVVLCLIISGVVALQYAGRDASQTVYLLSGFLAPTLPSIWAFVRGEQNKKVAEDTQTVVNQVKKQTNGHSEMIQEVTKLAQINGQDISELKGKLEGDDTSGAGTVH